MKSICFFMMVPRDTFFFIVYNNCTRAFFLKFLSLYFFRSSQKYSETMTDVIMYKSVEDQISIIINAIHQDDITTVTETLSKVNARFSLEMTDLASYASKYGATKVLRYLFVNERVNPEMRILVNASEIRQSTSFIHNAVKIQNLEMCKMLVEEFHVDVNRSLSDETPLLVAIKSGNIPLCTYLIVNAKADVRGSYYNRPLFAAIENGNVQLCELLIKHGVDINEGYRDGSAPRNLFDDITATKMTVPIFACLFRTAHHDSYAKPRVSIWGDNVEYHHSLVDDYWNPNIKLYINGARAIIIMLQYRKKTTLLKWLSVDLIRMLFSFLIIL